MFSLFVLQIILALYSDLLGFICTRAESSNPVTCSHPTGPNTPGNQSVPFLIPRDSVQGPSLAHPTKLCVLGGGMNLSLDFPSSSPWKFRELLEALLSGVSRLPCSWLFLVTPSPPMNHVFQKLPEKASGANRKAGARVREMGIRNELSCHRGRSEKVAPRLLAKRAPSRCTLELSAPTQLCRRMAVSPARPMGHLLSAGGAQSGVGRAQGRSPVTEVTVLGRRRGGGAWDTSVSKPRR